MANWTKVSGVEAEPWWQKTWERASRRLQVDITASVGDVTLNIGDLAIPTRWSKATMISYHGGGPRALAGNAIAGGDDCTQRLVLVLVV